LPDQNLGLAIFLSPPVSGSTPLPQDADNYLAKVQTTNGIARWYVAGAWDQESSEPMLSNARSPREKSNNTKVVLPSRGLTKREEFVSYAKMMDVALTQPAKVTLLSTSAAPLR
jgi:hypothetical protein